jgi:hypothetical protein
MPERHNMHKLQHEKEKNVLKKTHKICFFFSLFALRRLFSIASTHKQEKSAPALPRELGEKERKKKNKKKEKKIPEPNEATIAIRQNGNPAANQFQSSVTMAHNTKQIMFRRANTICRGTKASKMRS